MKQKPSYWKLDMAAQQEESQDQGQRLTRPLSQKSHKNIKLISVIYTIGLGADLCRPCAFCFSFCALIRTLLS